MAENYTVYFPITLCRVCGHASTRNRCVLGAVGSYCDAHVATAMDGAREMKARTVEEVLTTGVLRGVPMYDPREAPDE